MIIPPNLHFAYLQLELAPDGGLRYRPAALRELCRENGIDAEAVTGDEDRACALIAEWYVLHREAGGQADSVAETVVAVLNARGTPR